MNGSPFSRVSIAAAITTVALIAAAWTAGGGAMFSPGALRVADSIPTTLGGVASHAALKRECGSCHAAPWARAGMDSKCLDCHTDIARDMRDTATLHGHLDEVRRCVGCHTEHLGETARITRTEGLGEAHTRFGFALAAHRETAKGAAFTCNDCHEPATFTFDDGNCVRCHRDYQSAFVTRHVKEWGEDCRACHDGADRFSRGAFAHDTSGFRLDGAHLKTSCVGCHVDTRTLEAFSRTPTTCAGCHRDDDEHRGEFGDDCGACHTTRSWEGANIRHDDFPLDHGEGGVIACKTCHENSSNYKSYTCYNCHEHSPARVQAEHRGEVSTQNLDDCVRCHRGGRKEGEEEHRRGRREH